MEKNLQILLIIFILIILLLFILVFVFNKNKPPSEVTPYSFLEQSVSETKTTEVLNNGCTNITYTFNGTSKDNFFTVKFSDGNSSFVFPKSGAYDVQLNFTCLHSNFTSQDFLIYFLWSTTPLAGTLQPETYSSIYNQDVENNTVTLSGPEITTYSVITWCNGNEGEYKYDYRLQAGQADLYSYKCPLIVISYPCKSSSDNRCHSNYYTFTCTIVADTSTRYYPLFAVSSGSTFDGLGNVFYQTAL